MQSVRPRADNAPRWASISMPIAPPETIVTPAEATNAAMFRAHLFPAPVEARAPTIERYSPARGVSGRAPRNHRPIGSSSPRQASCSGQRGSLGTRNPPPLRATRSRSASISTNSARSRHLFHCVRQSIRWCTASCSGTPVHRDCSHSRAPQSPKILRTTRAHGSPGSATADHQAASHSSLSFILICSISQLLCCNDVFKGGARCAVKISERPRQTQHPINTSHRGVPGVHQPIQLSDE